MAVLVISMTWPQLQRAECTLDGQVVKLTRRETNLLSCLLMRYPEPVAYHAMIEMIWENPDFEPDHAKQALALHVVQLRKKLGKHAIKTRFGVGMAVCQTKAEQECQDWLNPRDDKAEKVAKPRVQQPSARWFIGKAEVAVDGTVHRVRHTGTNYSKVHAAVSGDVERLTRDHVPLRLSISVAEDRRVRYGDGRYAG